MVGGKGWGDTVPIERLAAALHSRPPRTVIDQTRPFHGIEQSFSRARVVVKDKPLCRTSSSGPAHRPSWFGDADWMARTGITVEKGMISGDPRSPLLYLSRYNPLFRVDDKKQPWASSSSSCVLCSSGLLSVQYIHYLYVARTVTCMEPIMRRQQNWPCLLSPPPWSPCPPFPP